MALETEILSEEKKLIENIQLQNVCFYGNHHPINTVSVSGCFNGTEKK